MSLALANGWDTQVAREIAKDISTISGLYCGPAAVAWIAAIWNHSKGRAYEYKKRLKDKVLFPDGPRPFHLDLPGFQENLSALLRRETNNELQLSPEIYYRYDSIHKVMEKYPMPIIIRMPAPRLKDGLHYVTLYKSEKQLEQHRPDRIQFYWQDNGLYKSSEAMSSGLSKSSWKNVSPNIFVWGAKRVVKV